MAAAGAPALFAHRLTSQGPAELQRAGIMHLGALSQRALVVVGPIHLSVFMCVRCGGRRCGGLHARAHACMAASEVFVSSPEQS